MARVLAAGGTWRRVVTDPLSGAVLDERLERGLAQAVGAMTGTDEIPGDLPADLPALDDGARHGAGQERPPRLETWGPRPGEPAGAFEAVPYPRALHAPSTRWAWPSS
ncbi:MAG: hypothetical protein Q4C85_01330 [Actinomyces sp.]|uniref:hypothetical protein n=1 Tax=Actinomyces sp. TaxID=29317 RepID=UPI0026DC5CCF|nr:hypothetical protein [Actinomyces sp.]MDO4242404.1 hypothetical protein [Actinomyces sp.]